ncbi:hypothetical protein [Xanthomonas bonasiae]|uniref:hypothetical protein n=1 Tax=Xanthomonas bonasiae TaxID=2810351 RepID=UPI00178013DC|nr:hypothetical protein [Xanthomonas surreyensis]MBD7923166.1 hypothetical protein [Xanthomonas surreyensis]
MPISNDRELLLEFATDVYVWLDACYLVNSQTSERNEMWPILHPYVALRPAGEEAWLELKEHQPLNEVISLISKAPDAKLQAHGLTGTQLRYKLSVLQDLAKRMRRVKFPGRFRPKLVDAIDTILDSLLSAVGAGTALKEIKDMLRAQV